MFEDIYRKVIDKLEQGLPKWLVYHDVQHTQYVLKMATTIATEENIEERELLLVKIAALFHDTGFLIQREGHEDMGCTIASRDLNKSDLSADEVEQICGMIRATRIPQMPLTHLEQIVADADLEYLGSNHFDLFSNRLYQELLHYDPHLTARDWDKIQVDFLSKHSYHTTFCKKNKEPVKQKNLEKVRNRLLEFGK